MKLEESIIKFDLFVLIKKYAKFMKFEGFLNAFINVSYFFIQIDFKNK